LARRFGDLIYTPEAASGEAISRGPQKEALGGLWW
jgi:hypothetical protein